MNHQATPDRLLEQLRAGRPRLLKLKPDNLVPRPWGGRRLVEYKGLDPSSYAGRYGEAFEVSAFPDDPEAREHPSLVMLDGGGEMELAELLRAAGREVLGSEHLGRYGPSIPLLPKTIDVVELLSVQAHPPGQIELYVILEAEPGATIRLGLGQDVEPWQLSERLRTGRGQQQQLLGMLRNPSQAAALQAALAPELAQRDNHPGRMLGAISDLLSARFDGRQVERLLGNLHALYWSVLGLLNEIPVRAGQVILNATPPRLAGDRLASAELHALGNPERREILMVEIRKPGITLRAWDNVRFPLREIQVSEAWRAVNLQATQPDEFRVLPTPDPDQEGVLRLVDTHAFSVCLLKPEPGRAVMVPASKAAQTVHAVRGQAQLCAPDGRPLAQLTRGESAVVPASLPGYRVEALGSAVELVQATV